MKYDLIIFDLGNVVLKFDHTISASKIAKRFGLDKNHLYDLFFDSKITRLHDEGKLSSKEFHSRMTKLMDVPIGFKNFKDCWNNIFVMNSGIEPIIKKLKKRHKVYLMSNTNKLHFEFLKKRFAVLKEFDKVILSYKIGELKPHPKIYRYALKAAGTTPQRTIYIDDRKELIDGARALGIESILFRNVGQLKKDLKKTLKRY